MQLDPEAMRLAALRRHEIVGSDPEQVFDDLTRLAATLCQAPIALISFIESDRQWVKSRVGLDVVDVSRDLSFCAQAILGEGVLEISDLAADARHADHPLVARGPRLRAYAGAPLLDRDGHALGALCVMDRSPRRLSDAQRRGLSVLARQVVAQLELRRRERELIVQRADLARARADALASARAKEVFLANMGHELRTPLNAILGCAELLLEEATTAGLTELMPDIQTIDRSGRHLVAVIEDILDLARLEAGVPQLRRDDVAIPALVDELHAAVRPQLRGKRLNWRAEVQPDLRDMYTDPTKLRQILMNLLSNAVKFTARGGIEFIVERVHGGDHGFISFRIVDTGIGIAEGNLELLFRDFTQVHDPSHSYGGTGLGLAISRRFARLLGGDILVASELGRGSQFTLLLPCGAREGSA